MSYRNLLRSTVMAWLVSAFLVGCASGARQGGGGMVDEARANQLPDYELDTLDGGKFRLSDHLGKEVILMDFWATWCDPCMASMPHLDGLYKKHKKDGFVIVGISIDGPDSLAQVRTEVDKRSISFPILLDTETRVVALYNPKSTAPYSILIGRDGRVISKREGYTSGGTAALDSEVQEAVAKK